MKRLLASNLWPMLTTESGDTRLARFLLRVDSPLDCLLEALLFYDEIIVPTQDFLIVPALCSRLGERNLLALIECGALRFSRVKGLFALAPSGLISAAVQNKNGQAYPFAADLAWTAHWASKEFAKASEADTLSRLIVGATDEVDASAIVTAIAPEVALDLTSNAELRESAGLGDFAPHTLRSDQVHLYGGPDAPSEVAAIDAFLRAAQANAEIDLAARNACADVATASYLDVLIRAKLQRELRSEIGERVLEIADVPDVGPLVRSGALPLPALLKLRESRDAVAFRGWIHDNLMTADPVEVAKAYTALLRGTDAVDGTIGRILRAFTWTALTTPAGLAVAGPVGAAIGAAAGVATTLVDSFLISKLRLRSSPVVFLDRLRAATDKAMRG